MRRKISHSEIVAQLTQEVCALIDQRDHATKEIAKLQALIECCKKLQELEE